MKHVEQVMGTAISVEILDSEDRGLIAELVAWFHEVDRVFSPYAVDSTISRIGRGELAPTDSEVSGDVRAVLARCGELRDESGGVFDVWSLPSPNGTRFDPCGYVKGWSVQRATELLSSRGIRNYCINAGGDVAVSGSRGGGARWRIGVRDPDDAGAVALVVEALGSMAVATSGCYERGAHIVDPRSGATVNEFASATVLGSNAADADAYATTLFIMGIDGLQWLAGRDGFSGCLLTHDRRVLSTDEFDAYLATGSEEGDCSSAGRRCRNPESSNKS
ncbi:MAG: FAD:protein FMN transferase [Actinobacteria bacterium]|nr:FAD:protein FMN transferase [Actinomycetota bacterium]